MSWLFFALLFWVAAWALNVRLSHSGLVRTRAGRLVVPAIFGITLLVVWEGIVRGLAVPGVILPPPSAIGARLVTELPTLWADFRQTFQPHSLTVLRIKARF